MVSERLLMVLHQREIIVSHPETGATSIVTVPLGWLKMLAEAVLTRSPAQLVHYR